MILDCTCFRIRRLSRQITQLYDEALRPTGLRVTQFSMLSALRNGGPMTVAALAQGLGADPTSISRALRPVIAKELAVLSEGPDKRSKSVALTDLGQAKLDAANPYWETAQSKVASLLSPDWRERFDHQLDEVSERIGSS